MEVEEYLHNSMNEWSRAATGYSFWIAIQKKLRNTNTYKNIYNLALL